MRIRYDMESWYWSPARYCSGASIKLHRASLVGCFAEMSKDGDYMATLNRKTYLTGQPQMMLSVISRDWCLSQFITTEQIFGFRITFQNISQPLN
jgi:hypothetical protein